eukprot:TRINITY_DN34054_c0_g1_i1.p1 TRINITY_DN34054_c0_g1~~TRINITY_DN34054_c0_g1_i1.p1  ORF type:complete len:1469 (-),score=257.69 TRINITY_DN34054_c0_g1_i1:77-3856(-)
MPGLLPQIGEQLLRQRDVVLTFSALEITSGEGLRDLLVDAAICGTAAAMSQSATPNRSGGSSAMPAPATTPRLAVVDHPAVGSFVAGLTEVVCSSAAELSELLSHCAQERVVSAASFGSTSRSCVQYALRVFPQVNGDGNGSFASRIIFADLAGSEAAPGATAPLATSPASPQKAGKFPVRLRPAASSQSLTALHCAVRALSELPGGRGGQNQASPKSTLEASKLTMLLRAPLLGQMRTVLVASVSPTIHDVDQTLRTLHFAASVGRLRASPFPPGRQRPISEVVALLQEQVRQLRQQLTVQSTSSSSGPPAPMPHIAQAVDGWEPLLELFSRIPSRSEASEIYQRAAQELEAARRQRGIFTNGSYLGDGIPFLTNLNSDAQLSGVLVFLLRSQGGPHVVGSSKSCGVVLRGVGIPPRLCELVVVNREEVTLRLSASCSQQQACRCTVNGCILRRGKDVQLGHGDRLIFGWAHVYRLHAPGRIRGGALAPPELPHMTDEDAVCEFVAEDSETYCELSLYIEDIREKMSEDMAAEFLQLLRKACHLVDEANEITREMRTDVDLKFDIDFVWDIFRRPEDVMVIRQLQMPGCASAEGENKVLHYWTFGKFCERLLEMRSAFNEHINIGTNCEGIESPLEDPWSELTLAQTRHNAQLQRAALSETISSLVISRTDEHITPVSNFREMEAGTGAAGANATAASSVVRPRPTSIGRSASVQDTGGPQPRDASRSQAGLAVQKSTPLRGRPTSNATASGAQRRFGGNVGGGGLEGGVGGPPAFSGCGGSSVASGQRTAESSWDRDAARAAAAAASSTEMPGGPRPRAASPVTGAHMSAVAEIEKLRRDAQKQNAEVRRLKTELLQAERERRLHAELCDSLRSQLSDKDELVAALRVLVRDRTAERERLSGALLKNNGQVQAQLVKIRETQEVRETSTSQQLDEEHLLQDPIYKGPLVTSPPLSSWSAHGRLQQALSDDIEITHRTAAMKSTPEESAIYSSHSASTLSPANNSTVSSGMWHGDGDVPGRSRRKIDTSSQAASGPSRDSTFGGATRATVESIGGGSSDRAPSYDNAFVSVAEERIQAMHASSSSTPAGGFGTHVGTPSVSGIFSPPAPETSARGSPFGQPLSSNSRHGSLSPTPAAVMAAMIPSGVTPAPVPVQSSRGFSQQRGSVGPQVGNIGRMVGGSVGSCAVAQMGGTVPVPSAAATSGGSGSLQLAPQVRVMMSPTGRTGWNPTPRSPGAPSYPSSTEVHTRLRPVQSQMGT